MNADQELARLRDMNRARAKRHYDAKKDEINAKRREKYLNTLISQQEINLAKKETDTNPIFSYNYISDELEEREMNKRSKSKYLDDLRRFVVLTNCEDNVIACINDYKKTIPIIHNAVKFDGTPYALNTKKSLFQVILYIIDNLKLPVKDIIKNWYVKEFEIMKLDSIDKNIVDQDTIIISFTDYLKKIKERFGEESKEYLISLLYNEATLRDDFILKIVPSIKDTKDDNENFIIVSPKEENLTLIINHYKTRELYGVIKIRLSIGLSRMIRKYIQVENLSMNDYLFGNKNLSTFVQKMNKEIDVNGGINLYRKMKISEMYKKYDGNPSAEERINLSNLMVHSPILQTRYLRNIKN
jgi:hypothetical protein